MKQKATPHPPSRGFTLVEVIVVLGIIIGLSTVVFGYVQSAQTSAEVSRLMRDADFVRSAVVSYGQQHNGNYLALTHISTGIGSNVDAGGTNVLVSVGLLPSRFTLEGTAGTGGAANTYEASAENPFGTYWSIFGKSDGGYTLIAYADAPQATSSLFNKWNDENGGDGDCFDSSPYTTIDLYIHCSFTD